MSMWYRVTLSILPPVISRQSGALPFGVDADMFRDPQGRYALPGSLIRGNLKENWMLLNKLGATVDIKKWLGESDDTLDQRGCLIFEPFWTLDGETVPDERIRIKIDDGTRSVGSKMLQVAKVLDNKERGSGDNAPEKPLIFSGHILLLDDKPDKELKEWIRKGLLMTPALGGEKGVGLGRMHEVNITDTAAPAVLTSASRELDKETIAHIIQTGRVGLRLRPLWPFCFALHGPKKSNALVSSDSIPGAAIKAVIARVAKKQSQWQQIKPLFDAVRVTHALSVNHQATCRPVVPPLSLVFAGGDLRDVAYMEEPGLIKQVAPAFQPDWKQRHLNSARSELGWPGEIERMLVVRNKHDLNKRAAEDKGLFAVEMVKPDPEQVWLCNIDFPKYGNGVTDSDVREFLKILAEIAKGQSFLPLGKTKTPAIVEIVSGGFDFAVQERPIEKNQIVIALQTPARLFNVEDIQDIPQTGGGGELLKCYRCIWDELSNESLRLSHYYARQTLMGGDYWWKRYGKCSKPLYQTQVFTDAGSVFVFDIKDREKAEEKIREWQRLGLPQVMGAPGMKDKDSEVTDASGMEDEDSRPKPWELNPWIRENGWGEIAVNLELHESWQPPIEE
ncbi:MAG: hypothetical protein GXP09_10310 [Gammaproteobacteria bacterium]|nr:hypothetical protein [Gammaproteobacteria bacterium]